MSEIAKYDGKVLRPFFKILHETYLGLPIFELALKIVEYIGNGPNPKGRHGTRIKWNSFDQLLLVGQSHLDAAWRWKTKQGILKARGTIKKALDHIDQVPEFTFSQPSPCYYQWMKDYFPHIYVRIQKAVKDGRFIPLGGSWVESDTNIPNAESLIRQRLYGQRFFLKEFGFISDTEVLQDCFGFNWNLPQIYGKSGAKIFATGKIFWNKTTKLPIGMCHWQGPDGTKLPMLHLYFGYLLPMNYGKDYPLIYLLGKPGQNLIANYKTTQKQFADWRSREYMMDNIFAYGMGDGGHGPLEAEILVAKFLRRLWPKRFKHYQNGDFYHLLKKHFPRWATWNDEWYLDYHRGTYTSVSRIKRGNRECEIQMETLEKLSTICALFGAPIPRDELEKIYKIILYNQFHDILPGSSIPEVYLEYDQDLAKIMQFINRNTTKIERILLATIKPNATLGSPIVVFNPLSWNRTNIVQIEMGTRSQGIFLDSKGNLIPSQFVKKIWDQLHPDATQYLALIQPQFVSSMGLELFYYSSKEEKSSLNPTDLKLNETSGEYSLENQFVTIKINKQTGLITQFYSNEFQIQLFNSPSNKLLIFDEQKKQDAWNINPNYYENPIDYDLKPESISVIESGPLRIAIQITRKIMNSSFIQRIAMVTHSPLVITELEMDLKDPRILCKIFFDTKIQTENITAEIPGAYINRTISPQTLLDKARWEQACQKWISISDNKIGFTITNNGKYGYNAKQSPLGGTIIQPTVVRTPTFTGYYPETMFVNRSPEGKLDPTMPQFTDIEHHYNVQYGLYLHANDWRNGAWQKAYEHNYPLHGTLHENLPSESKMDKPITAPIQFPFSMIQLDPTTVQCTAFKIAEDESNLSQPKQYVIRLVEQVGQATDVVLKFPSAIKISEISKVDLLELNPESLSPLNKNDVKIHIDPYEILSLKLKID